MKLNMMISWQLPCLGAVCVLQCHKVMHTLSLMHALSGIYHLYTKQVRGI